MKVGIVGAGRVGSACFLRVMMQGSAREVIATIAAGVNEKGTDL
jgi:malate/lactate dehydrogenase